LDRVRRGAVKQRTGSRTCGDPHDGFGGFREPAAPGSG